jgi:putative transposase
MKTVEKVKEFRQESLSEVCALFDLKRDAYYKYIKRYEIKEEQEQKVVDMVSLRRKRVPRSGSRKLHHYLQRDFERANLKIGRDRLFDILRDNKMLVKPK